MKKILVIIPSFYPNVENGGPIIHLHNLFKITSNKNLKIDIFTTNKNFEGKNKLFKNKITIKKNYTIFYYKINFSKFSLSLIKSIFLNINRYDYIYYNSFFDLYLLSTLFSSKKKIFLSPRGQLMINNIFQKKFILKKVFLFLVNRFNNKIKYIFSSQIEANDSKKVITDSVNYTILPNSSSFRAIKINKNYFNMKIKNKRKIILTISRLSKRKNIDLIIQTAKLFKNSDEYIFHIYGPDFGEKDKLNDFIKMNNLNNIQIKESLNEKEIINKFKKSFIFLLPSQNENFGNVFLESLQCFVPIITLEDSYWVKYLKQKKIGEYCKHSAISIKNKILKINSYYHNLNMNDFEYVQNIHHPKSISNKFIKILN